MRRRQSDIQRWSRPAARQRGVTAILAMMFLVIFASLAAAMAIVAQGNLATADTHLKINRALAAAETGQEWVTQRLNLCARNVSSTVGEVTVDNAPGLWTSILTQFRGLSLTDQNFDEATVNWDASPLVLPAISLGPGEPTFVAQIQYPSPGAGLDARWVRVRVRGTDGTINRTIEKDFRIDKKIRFALLSKSRVMIGRNVMIDGPVGSRFTETDLANGHPVQMESDFRGLDGDLDNNLNVFVSDYLVPNDQNGDNRINLLSAAETDGIDDPEQYDVNGDHYIDDYDFFLDHYDANSDGAISAVELNTDDSVNREQLFALIDRSGDPDREGYNDGQINNDDDYAKVRGQVLIVAGKEGWENGAASVDGEAGPYQDYFQGGIIPGHNQDPLIFESQEASTHEYGPQSFDLDTYRTRATGDLAAQATQQAAEHDPGDPDSPGALGEVAAHEAVPFGSAHPYDYYDRPVYRNMTFTNVRIPKGNNALFVNCKFIGVTFVETESDNTNDMFNYAGMQEADGTPKHPDKYVLIDPAQPDTEDNREYNTKNLANNLRFDGCTFEGSVVSDAPQAYTHARNKISFTGTTQFIIDDSTHLSPSEKALYRRSSILVPHYSVEMGTFVAPHDATETVHLTGTIVAGVIDIRGQAEITGTILTTFEPISGEGPVLGETSPQFNTTLGYFPSTAGDMEAEVPENGLGIIHLRYDPSLPLPEGIMGPIELAADSLSYKEVTSAD
ncbi:MAG: hypothetical protein IT443_05000 [Phycisphaeraceae bacterium]|nr:hypothetical protein [Phycisphaeraceae bacterium]